MGTGKVGVWQSQLGNLSMQASISLVQALIFKHEYGYTRGHSDIRIRFHTIGNRVNEYSNFSRQCSHARGLIWVESSLHLFFRQLCRQ